jgi:3-carboxy-cis,cis-muconate cycloisomerase
MTTESYYFQHLYASDEMRQVFSDQGKITAWLDVEAALARSEAACGLIPDSAAKAISAAAKFENMDIESMIEEYKRVGFPIVPLVHQLAKVCDPEAAKFIHWGATTQDIVDTGLVLQMRDGLELISSDLDVIIQSLAKVCETHRKTAMSGRTFQQQAAPITFGFKVAVWLDELLRHKQRLTEIKSRVLLCQFGGAVGTLATLNTQGLDVLKALSKELQLEEPAISWHTARDGWAEMVFWLSMLCTTFTKIANEVATLMRTEVNEVREPFTAGRGGSSTMPQKRNPVSCPLIVATGNKMRDLVGTQLTAMIQLHERDVATQPLEWLVIPEAFVLTSGCLKHSKEILCGLTVDVDSMKSNLEMGGGLLMSEAVMMGLAPKVGRGQAHDLVGQASASAIDQGTTLKEALLANESVMALLSEEEVDHLLNPLNYTGVASDMIDRVLAKV